MILPKNRSPELYEWLEAKLEEIGLSGRVYSRLIQSIMSLDSSCLKSELEAMIDVQKKDELLAREVLLAAQWKGSKESEDYWSFRELISNFLKKYQTCDSKAGRSKDDDDSFSDEVAKQSGEKYEEAFPSLSNACDEIAWKIMKNARNWSCLASPHDLSMLLAARKSTSSASDVTTATKYYLGSYCIDEVEMYLKKRLDQVCQCFYRENMSNKHPPRKLYRRRKRGESMKQCDSFRLVSMQNKKCCQHCSKRSQKEAVSSPQERIYCVKEGTEVTKKEEEKKKMVVLSSSDESTSRDEYRRPSRRIRRRLSVRNVEMLQKEYRGSKKDAVTWYDRLNNKCVVKENYESSNVWTPIEKLAIPNKFRSWMCEAVRDSPESDSDFDGLIDHNSWNDFSLSEKTDVVVSSDFISASNTSNGPIAHSTPKKDNDLDEDNLSSLVVSLSGPDVSDQSYPSDFLLGFDEKCKITDAIQLPKMSAIFSELNVESDGSACRSGITGKSRRKLVFDEPEKQPITLTTKSCFEDFLTSLRNRNADESGDGFDAVQEIVRNLLESSFVEKYSNSFQQPSEKQTSSSNLQQVSQPFKSSNASAEDNNEFWHGFWSYDGVLASQKREPCGNVGTSTKKFQKVSPLGVQLESSTLCDEKDDFVSSNWFLPWMNRETKVAAAQLNWVQYPVALNIMQNP